MSLENIEELFVKGEEFFAQKKYDQAIELMLKIKPDDGKEDYALAQFNLGTLYDQQDKFESAEQAYKNVIKDSSEDLFLKSQINLGLFYEKQERLKDAELVYKNLIKEYSGVIKAQAQLYLGVVYQNQGNTNQAERAYQKVLSANSEPWSVQAQFYLGVLYQQQGKRDDAEQAFKNVLKEDSSDEYVKAQLCLGLLYNEQEKFSEAEQAYKNALKHGDKENYARAQMNLGVLYQRQERFLEAEQTLKNVLIKDSKEEYARAQVVLGYIFSNLKRIDDGIKCYNNVKREYSLEYFSQAQFNLAVAFLRLGRSSDAEDAFINIPIEASEPYARAQVGLGDLHERKGELTKAEQAYTNVLKIHSSKQYARAQWKLCILKRDIEYLKVITVDDDLEIYAKAQFKLGEQQGELKEKSTYWIQVPKESRFYEQKKYIIHLTQKILVLENPSCENVLDQILSKVDQLLSFLFVASSSEQSIAHYTNLTVSKLLLGQKISEDKKTLAVSQLRLNTINLMNDPEEGLLLNKFLNYETQEKTSDQAFIACFTLHHDSLNQFRLYGKQNQQEASGLSLVLNKDFFAEGHNAASIYQKKQLENIMIDDGGNENFTVKDQNKLSAMPLYRCIYLDPTSNYIKVAQREEWSFCREDGKHPSDRWDTYSKEINQIEIEVRANLNELSDLIKGLNLEKLDEKVEELLAEILLPLRYLIKHMAFKEEQECRMVYVTQMDNDLIQYDDKINRVYIDYQPSLMQYLEKIYLAPKAADEKTVFEYLCAQGKKHGVNSKGVKVKISQNPFR